MNKVEVNGGICCEIEKVACIEDKIIGRVGDYNVRLTEFEYCDKSFKITYYIEKDMHASEVSNANRKLIEDCIRRYVLTKCKWEEKKIYQLEMKINLADNIKTYRQNKFMSQDELAAELGVERQTISKWETGKSEPDIISLLRLSKIFNVSMDSLVTGYAIPNKIGFTNDALFKNNKLAEKIIMRLPKSKVRLMAKSNKELWDMLQEYFTHDIEFPLSIDCFKSLLLNASDVQQSKFVAKLEDDLINLVDMHINGIKRQLNNNLDGLVILIKSGINYPMDRIYKSCLEMSHIVGNDKDSIMASVIYEDMLDCCEMRFIGIKN